MDVREKIDKLRKQHGLSKFQLAKSIGISPTSVYNWYNEINSMPKRDTIEDICALFNISVASFYASTEAEDLPAEEIELLEAFRKLPTKKKETALMIIKNLND